MLAGIKKFIVHTYLQRQLIVSMAKREIEIRYAGSFLGIAWTVIQPMVMITVYWFVFTRGFRVTTVNDVPFVAWLAAGISAWYFFAEVINSSCHLVVQHTNLIKKTLFQPQILPIIKLLSSSITHLAFVSILIILLLFQHMPVTIFWLQFFYYLFALLVFCLGVAWAVSALNVFIRDIGQIVAVSLQVGFWITPIFWNIEMLPEKAQFFLKLNPMFYIIQGYRDSFIYSVWFWERPYLSLYYWLVALLTFTVGALIFKKLKPQFADVL